MARVDVSLRSIPGAQAALGRAGGHTLVADRPAGRAGGEGLGFNGAELLALAIGGCLANDLRYLAHAEGVEIVAIAIEVALTLEGEPSIVTGAEVRVAVEGPDPAAIAGIVARAEADSTVAGSLVRGVPVRFLSV